jgi:hypothetical protein
MRGCGGERTRLAAHHAGVLRGHPQSRWLAAVGGLREQMTRHEEGIGDERRDDGAADGGGYQVRVFRLGDDPWLRPKSAEIVPKVRPVDINGQDGEQDADQGEDQAEEDGPVLGAPGSSHGEYDHGHRLGHSGQQPRAIVGHGDRGA